MDKMPQDVPYIVYEGTMVRFERIIKRLVIGLVICIVLLFLSNAFWLYEWSSYDYSDNTITVDSADGGNANYIGEDGDITNGEGNSEKAYKTKEER